DLPKRQQTPQEARPARRSIQSPAVSSRGVLVLSSIRLARAALSAALLAPLTLLAAAPAQAAKPTKGPAPAPSATLNRDWGVTLPGLPSGTAELSALAAAVGDQPGVVMWYDAWSNKTVFPAEAAHRNS